MNSSAVRTSGDGTENPDKTTIESCFKPPAKKSSNPDVSKLGKEYLSEQLKSTSAVKQIFFNPSTSGKENFLTNYPPQVTPKGKKFYLIPKLVTPRATLPAPNRKLNLVLMEPYRACVNPIIPYKKNENKVKKPNKNNLALNELVKHLSMHDKSNAASEIGSDDELATLKKERDALESQLSFQMQVNAELKSLLVHCLGEDIQAKVNNLTEDKMKIAKSLSCNTEQIEFLSSQTEVYRSKFLASSLMVEELAKVKTKLTQKNSQLESSNKQLLGTLERVRFNLIETFQNIKFISGVQENNLKSLNAIDLSAECLNISQQLVLNSGKIGLPASNNLDYLETLTEAEKNAKLTLADTGPASPLDDAFKAVCTKAHQEYSREKEKSDK